MQVSRLPASAGRRWVVEGFQLLRRQPVPLLLLVVICMFLLGVSSAIPLGPFVWALGTPLLLVGLMRAVRAVDRGDPPSPKMLLAAIQEDGGRAVKPLLLLGLTNVVASMVALAIVSMLVGGLPDPEALTQQAPEGGGTPGVPEVTVPDTSMLLAPALFLALYIPVQMALWYAPLFVAWHGVPPRKAMFFSFVATWRNRWAFVQFGLTWFAVALAVSLVFRLLEGVFGEDSSMLAFFVLSPVSLVMTGALLCSLWPTYRDAVLPDNEPSAGERGPH
jgi:hypothetical protein